MNFETILYEEINGVAIIRLNRPGQLNAMNEQLMRDVIQACTLITENPSVRAAVITGAGRAFSAGGDVQEIKQGYGGEIGFLAHMHLVNNMILALAELSKPLIAAVNGVATGMGMNTALCADIILAAEDARFSQIFGKIGLVPDSGGSYLLARLIGLAKAKELIFSSRIIEAQEAQTLGLVNRIIPSDELLPEALALAETLAQGPTFAMITAKKMIHNCYSVDLRTALDNEASAQVLAAGTADHAEGICAFQEKRRPVFIGR